MSNVPKQQGVWFLYDGECPLCTNAAHAFRLREKYGALHLINARENNGHPLLVEATKRRLDLDEGMVIVHNDNFYHGRDALLFIADTAKPDGWFNVFSKTLFKTRMLSSIFYPWLRGTRNALIRRNGAGKIDNLKRREEPIFKDVFGQNWKGLPSVIKKHYANRPYGDDLVRVQGHLDVFCAGPIKAFGFVFSFLKNIPPYNETNVPVTVDFRSDKNTKKFHFERTFYFKNKKPYKFRSYMLQIKDDDVMEITRTGMGWRMLYGWENDRVVMKHKGYALPLLGHILSAPMEWLMGKGYAEEIPVDDNTFDMRMHLTHPLWGKIYEYKGRFKVTKEV